MILVIIHIMREHGLNLQKENIVFLHPIDACQGRDTWEACTATANSPVPIGSLSNTFVKLKPVPLFKTLLKSFFMLYSVGIAMASSPLHNVAAMETTAQTHASYRISRSFPPSRAVDSGR